MITGNKSIQPLNKIYIESNLEPLRAYKYNIGKSTFTYRIAYKREKTPIKIILIKDINNILKLEFMN